MFRLNEAEVEVVNVNHRIERHGDKPKLCFDLKVATMCHNSVLDNFDPLLRQLLYRAPGSGEQQRLPVDSLDTLTELRPLSLAPLKWDEDYPGYKVTFATGLGLQKPVVIEQVKLSNFVFEAQEGGSVAISFRISGFEPQDAKVKLQTLLTHDPVVTLDPPEPTAFPQPGDQVGDIVAEASKDHVLVTGCELKPVKGGSLTEATVTLSDGRVLKLQPLAYTPDVAQVIDLIKFDHGLDAQFTPALRDEFAAKAA